MPIPQSGLRQVTTLEQGKSIRTVPMHKPSSTEVRTLVERDLTQQQSRLSDAPQADDSQDPPPAPARLRVRAGPGSSRRILRSNGDCKHPNAGAIHG
ncbi:hypothetical protein MRX96_052430 [Rhipicephalus microplus]